MKHFLILLILTLAFVLRFYQLGHYPLSLDWDEASNGYNAYSILKTGRDEYGDLLPLSNRSFEDYKPAAYMYMLVPTVSMLGLTEYAVRLPSALLGVLTIPLLYFLTKRITNSQKMALLASFFLAIAPWNINLSRAGFEANVSLFFIIASITFTLYTISTHKSKKQIFLLVLAAIFTGLSFYTYHSARIFLPLVLIALSLIYRKNIFEISKIQLAVFVFVSLILVLPFFINSPLSAISQRLKVTSTTSKVENLEKSVIFIEQDKESKLFGGNIIHNRRIVLSLSYLDNYLSHFDFNFLFTSGDDNFRHHTKNMGMLFLYQLPLIILGLYQLIRVRTKGSALILVWLLLSPLPAAPTEAVPHAIRSYTMIIPLIFLSALGLKILSDYKRSLALILLLPICTFSFLLYLHNYYFHYASDYSSWWQYGYKEAVFETKNITDKKIYIDESIEQAYIYWLLYTKANPKEYQDLGNKGSFKNVVFSGNNPTAGSIFISSANEFPATYKLISTVNSPKGQAEIKIGEVR